MKREHACLVMQVLQLGEQATRAKHIKFSTLDSRNAMVIRQCAHDVHTDSSVMQWWIQQPRIPREHSEQSFEQCHRLEQRTVHEYQIIAW